MVFEAMFSLKEIPVLLQITGPRTSLCKNRDYEAERKRHSDTIERIRQKLYVIQANKRFYKKWKHYAHNETLSAADIDVLKVLCTVALSKTYAYGPGAYNQIALIRIMKSKLDAYAQAEVS